MASTLVENHSDLLLVPNDVAVEIDEERVGLTVEDLPVPHPIYDIGVETLMQLRPILMQAGCILWNGPASYFENPPSPSEPLRFSTCVPKLRP